MYSKTLCKVCAIKCCHKKKASAITFNLKRGEKRLIELIIDIQNFDNNTQ